jgi:hypothetical protein
MRAPWNVRRAKDDLHNTVLLELQLDSERAKIPKWSRAFWANLCATSNARTARIEAERVLHAHGR